MTDGGIPAVASNNALTPNQLRYLVAWVGAEGNNIQTALANRDGDLIVAPQPIYNPGFNIWKDISLIWNGEEYGLALALNQADGWKAYLVRIDKQGNFISSDLIGTGGPSTNAGPAIAWDGSRYALAWNPPSNDGALFARYSPATRKITLAPTRVMKSAYTCDTALAWNGTLFGIMCNSDYLAVNSQGGVIVTPVMGPCTWGTDPVPGFAGRPSIIWDGSRFQIAFRDHWRAGTYRWYGVPTGPIDSDGRNAACYGSAHGVEYPVTYTSMAFAPNARGGQRALGRLWLDNNRIKFEELLPIISNPTILGEPATALGNIVWAIDTYTAIWKNDSGIQLSFWPYAPPTATIAPPATVSTSISLKVLSPNGGEQWYQGNTYRITWQNPLPNGFAGHEDFRWNVALSRRGVESWQLGQVPIAYSYFDWKNWTFARSIPNSSDFKIQVGLANIKCQERLNSGETLVNVYCGLPAYVSVPAAGTWDDSDNAFGITTSPPASSTASTPIPSTATTTTSPTITITSTPVAATSTSTPTTTSTTTTTTTPTPTTTTDTTPPIISNCCNATNITSTSATITWTTNEPADSTVQYMKNIGDTQWTYSSTDTTLVTSHGFTLTGLASGTTYNYRPRSRDATGNLTVHDVGWSFTTSTTTATTTTTSASTPTTIVATDSGTPKAPANLTASVSVTGTNTGEIALAWLDNSGIETKYVVHRRPTYGTTWVTAATLAASATAYTDKIYAAGTYEYYVSACTINTNTLAESCGDSNTANATLVANYCPSPYRAVASDGRCVWSCGSGTQPDDPSNINGQCVCKAGYTESSTDQFGRRVCTQTTTTATTTTASSVLEILSGALQKLQELIKTFR